MSLLNRVKTTIAYLLLTAGIMLHSAVVGQFSFTENKGQWPDHVFARTPVPSGFMYVENDGLKFVLHDKSLLADLHHSRGLEGKEFYDFHCFKIKFEGGSAAEASMKSKQINYQNFYLGDDPASWAEGCGMYKELNLIDVWAGIDVRIFTDGFKLKYEFLVAPGVNPDQVKLTFLGLEGVYLQNGSLVMPSATGDLMENPPVAWQMGDLAENLSCKFELKNQTLGFKLGQYDKNLPLVIDPEFVFGSFSGSTTDNWGFTACNDNLGNLIAGSITFGNGYPTTIGAFQTTMSSAAGNLVDIGISKFNPTGTQLLYSTYLGGSLQEMPHSVVCDSQNNFIVFGQSASSNFPTTASAFQPDFVPGWPVTYQSGLGDAPNCTDLVLTKFSANGAILGSTFIGGNNEDGLNHGNKVMYNYGDSFRGQVATDENDNIYVASCTRSTDFPGTSSGAFPNFSFGLTDGVVFKMNPGLSNLLWSSYIGGSDSDAAYSVQIDPGGNVLVGGGTKSNNLPVSPNAMQTNFGGDVDGFVFKFSSNGAFLNGTYVGTGSYDQVYFVQSDVAGNVYVLGQTTGDFQISPSCYGNPGGGIFIRKIAPGLTNGIWTTRIGAGGNITGIAPSAFLVSNCGQIYFSGWGGVTNGMVSGFWGDSSTTQGMPLTADAFQSTTDGSDFYLGVLGLDAATLDYATFFGGSGLSVNEHVDGGSSSFDKNGSVYQAVCAGCGSNDSFPTTPGAWSNTNPSNNCNLGVFKFDLGQLVANIGIDGPGFVCSGEQAQLVNLSVGGTDFLWDFGDGTTSQEFEPLHTFSTPGIYTISLLVTDDTECLEPTTDTIVIEVLPGVNPTILPPNPICPGTSMPLSGTGSTEMYWLPDPTLDLSDPNTPIASPTITTTYYLVDSNDCETDTASVTLEVLNPQYTISPDAFLCIGETAPLSVNPASNVVWSPSSGVANPNSGNTTATPDEDTIYFVNFLSPEGCTLQDSVVIEVFADFPGGQIYPEETICIGNSVELMAEPGTDWDWTPAASLNFGGIQNPTASPTQTTTYFVTVNNPCGTGISQVTVNVIVPQVSASPGGAVCIGDSLQLSASGGVQFAWFPQTFIDDPFSQNPWVYPPENTVYTVLVTDEFGCSETAQSEITILPLPQVNAGADIIAFWGDETPIQGTGTGTLFWSPNENIPCVDCMVFTVSPDQSTSLVLNAIDQNGCKNSDEIFIQINGPLYVPNAITVTADGVNDIFFAYGLGVQDFQLQVFNRWGELIWETTDLSKGWNGTYKGRIVQEDVYVWRMEYTGKTTRQIVYGHVTVIR